MTDPTPPPQTVPLDVETVRALRSIDRRLAILNRNVDAIRWLVVLWTAPPDLLWFIDCLRMPAGARILARSKAEGDLLGEIRAKADAQAAQERGTR